MAQHLKSAVILHTFACRVLQGIYVKAFGRSVLAGGLRGGLLHTQVIPLSGAIEGFSSLLGLG